MNDDWHREELFKGMLSLIVESLKMVAWINGGAAIAVLTYLGNLATHNHSIPNIKPTILWYCIGLTAAALAFVVGYITELRLWEELNRKARGEAVVRYHHIGLVIGCALAFLGVLAFFRGSILAAEALTLPN
jgi:hypothetical protein